MKKIDWLGVSFVVVVIGLVCLYMYTLTHDTRVRGTPPDWEGLMPEAWIPSTPAVSVHQARSGWRVDVWVRDKLVYSEVWDKRPTQQERRGLIAKYSKSG